MYHEYIQLLQSDISIDIYELNTADGSTYPSSSSMMSLNEGSNNNRQKHPCKENSQSFKHDLNSNFNVILQQQIEQHLAANQPYDEEEQEYGESDLGCVQLARAHWIQLHRLNLQTLAIQQTFVHILQNHKQMRPIWHFTRGIDDSNDEWIKDLLKSSHFRHHCTSVQAALTLIMDNLDDCDGLTKLLQELGAHHFFYDAFEAHLELIHDSFIASLKELLKGTSEALDGRLQMAWNKLWKKIKVNMACGIFVERCIYLSQCVTPAEMKLVKNMWDKVQCSVERRVCGEHVAGTALKVYEELLHKYKIGDMKEGISGLTEQNSEIFAKFSMEIINSLDRTISLYTPESGFSNLVDELNGFVHHCIILDVCPSLVRKAFMQGLIAMLASVLGEAEMNENVVHTWSKVYRVLEQAILANILEY